MQLVAFSTDYLRRRKNIVSILIRLSRNITRSSCKILATSDFLVSKINVYNIARAILYPQTTVSRLIRDYEHRQKLSLALSRCEYCDRNSRKSYPIS